MKPIDIRYYPLPTGEFVVSYFDTLRRERVPETFTEESKATEAYNRLRMWKPVKDQKRSLQQCSIEELLGVYLEEVPGASLDKSTQLIKDLLNSFAFHRPAQIDEIAMRSFYQRQKLEYDYTSHSLATRKYQIQGFFKWLVSRGLIEDSPQSKITMGRSKVYKRKHIWVKQDQIKSLLSGAKKQSPGFLYPMLLLIHETAAKTSDVIELKWQDVDLKGKKIILREGEKIQLRALPISDDLVASIKSIDQLGEYVFTNLEGRPLYKQCLVRELRILKRQLGIEQDWVFRDLRHSHAVNFLKAGGDIETLKAVLGHQHVRMTEELYGRFKSSKADFFDVEVVPETGTLASGNNEY
jgi:integrase